METITRSDDRTPPNEARAARVKELIDMVLDDCDHWKWDFDRMRTSRRYARGLQWKGMTRKDLVKDDRPYVANITMRHLKSRTAAIYARNPRFTWRQSKRLHHVLWDGTPKMLQDAMAMQMGTPDSTDPATGAVIPGTPPVENPLAAAIIQEATEFAQSQQAIKKTGETLAIVYEYFVREQVFNIKHMMKRTVLQSGTCGVGYIKQSFQRVLQNRPEVEQGLADAKAQLDAITRISQELAFGETDPNEADADRLRSLMKQMEAEPKILLREGLTFNFPDPLNIIPSKEMIFLPGFFGCPHVTEQYFLTEAKVKETYGVDLGKQAAPYRSRDAANKSGNRLDYKKTGSQWQDGDTARVFEIYHKGDGLVYTVCEGYDDFLREPEPPFPWTERFWPWFIYAPNAMDDPENPMPPSDVELIEPMQNEINAAGDALRDHRFAARPGHVKAGYLTDDDAAKITSRVAHQVVPLTGLQPGDDVSKVLQPFPTAPIDPNLYATGPAFEDMLRTTGTQQANLGPTTDATATEATIAQSSRQSTDDSAIDELDDLLTEMARAGGQILLMNLEPETVKKIVGPGAAWPTSTRDEVAQELYLEVEAGSSGKKNQAHEIQVRTQMYPFLIQTPNIDPEKFARDMLSVLDDRIRFEDWQKDGLPSIIAMNGQAQAAANLGDPSAAPEAQGPDGASNAPQQQAPGAPGPQTKEPFTPPV